MKHLHIGINAADLICAHNVVRQTFKVHMDGDGWETWGEAVGTAGNDLDTFHFVVHVKGRKQARRVVTALHGSVTLQPMAQRDQRAIIAVLTDAADHERVHHRWRAHVNYPHHPGYLIDCPACEADCHCQDGNAECVWSGHDE